MQPTTDRAVGMNGELAFDGQFVIISRSGGYARMTVGGGEKRIPIGQVTAVQWKDARAFVRGFIEFTIAGGNENRSRAGRQAKDQMKNENGVVFTVDQAPPFRVLRAAIEAAMVAGANPSAAPVGGDLGTQLQQLADLHAQGVLTDDEFQAAKSRLLGT